MFPGAHFRILRGEHTSSQTSVGVGDPHRPRIRSGLPRSNTVEASPPPSPPTSLGSGQPTGSHHTHTHTQTHARMHTHTHTPSCRRAHVPWSPQRMASSHLQASRNWTPWGPLQLVRAAWVLCVPGVQPRVSRGDLLPYGNLSNVSAFKNVSSLNTAWTVGQIKGVGGSRGDWGRVWCLLTVDVFIGTKAPRAV